VDPDRDDAVVEDPSDVQVDRATVRRGPLQSTDCIDDELPRYRRFGQTGGATRRVDPPQTEYRLVNPPHSALIGRHDLLAVVTDALDGIGERGTSLLLSGEPGIGKSALLARARHEADVRGMRVVSTSGAGAELPLPFAALVGLVRPWQDVVEKLPAAQRDALLGALGRGHDQAQSPFLVALGLLELMSELAADGGLLILVDDVHAVDPASRDAVAFLTRRVADEPIVCLAARRSNHPGPWELAGRELTVGPLTESESAQVIARGSSAMAPAARRRVLTLARGNPLALIELPHSVGHGAVDGTYALTSRLESAFADRYAELPEGCRLAVAVGAANEGGTLAETLVAAGTVAGRPVSAHDLQPAIDAGLVSVSGMTLQFRHPLVRSAVNQAVAHATMRDVHAALAAALTAQPDRRAWHRALAALGRDDDVARDLDAATQRARRRGAPLVALGLAERAADLSADPRATVDRLLTAAELAADVGRPDAGSELLDRLRDAELTETQVARLTWVRELREDRVALDPDTVRRLVDVARSCHERGDDATALRLLRAAAHRCWWNPADHTPGRELFRVASAMGLDPDSPLMLFVRIAVRGAQDGDAVRARLATAWDADDTPAETLHLLGLTAQFAGDPVLAGRIFVATEVRYRERGQLGPLAQALVSHSVAAVLTGRFREARELTDEAVRLSNDVSSTRWQAAAHVAAAAAAACLDPAQPTAELPTGMLDDLGNPAQWALYAQVRGLAALARERYAEAWAHLGPTQQHGHRYFHETYRTWLLADLVEAGVHAGHADEVTGVVRELEAVPCPSPLLRLGLAFGRAMAADDGGREALFAAALAEDGLAGFPFVHARIRLEYGTWLRRQQRRAGARAQLRVARDLLAEVGAVTWAARAQRELVASGEASPATAERRTATLTAQELAIARLAATGLSNREIGARLFLSHRTVGSHLYRIFPKLAVTSRVQLVEALRTHAPHVASDA
jgi:DNA-binding CsgD family transcriptional regulator